jgi:hypothetical protein
LAVVAQKSEISNFPKSPYRRERVQEATWGVAFIGPGIAKRTTPYDRTNQDIARKSIRVLPDRTTE